MSDAEAVLMAQPLPVEPHPLQACRRSPTTTSSLIESPQVGFSWAMACGTWSASPFRAASGSGP